MPQKRRNGLSFVECVWQPVPNNGRPVAPYTSTCCLCSHWIQRCFVCTEERRENEVGCIRGERVCIRGERNGFVLILYPWGTGFCWYCIRGERVSVGIVSVGNGFLLVLCPWGTGFCWYCICGERVSVGIASVGNRFLLVSCPRGTGVCWYCVRGEQVSVGIGSTGLSCFCVQFSSLTVLGRGRSIYFRCDP